MVNGGKGYLKKQPAEEKQQFFCSIKFKLLFDWLKRCCVSQNMDMEGPPEGPAELNAHNINNRCFLTTQLAERTWNGRSEETAHA